MRSKEFREQMLKIIDSWDDERLSDLEFYKYSTLLFKKFIVMAREDPLRGTEEPMIALGLLGLEHYFESLPYYFYDKSYIPYMRERLQFDRRISRDEESALKLRLIPNESYEDGAKRLKDVSFYKPFARLLESMDLKTAQIDDPKKFGLAVSTTASWSGAKIEHPSGKISWIDTLSFQDISIVESEFTGKGLCYAGLTSGGIELNIPFSIYLNFKTQKVDFVLGDFFKNSPEVREKLTGFEKLYVKADINSEKFFKSLTFHYYSYLAKNLASKL